MLQHGERAGQPPTSKPRVPQPVQTCKRLTNLVRHSATGRKLWTTLRTEPRRAGRPSWTVGFPWAEEDTARADELVAKGERKRGNRDNG